MLHFIDGLANLAHPRDELIEGLLKTAAQISPKFFYDDLGSRLFVAITELPEYYPTRTEAAIYRHAARSMAQMLPRQPIVLDLGAGNCSKGEALFEWLKPAAYVAVDISLGHLKPNLTALHSRHPQLPKLGWGLDFSKPFNLDAGVQDWLTRHQLEGHPWVVFYPGSSIGNFSPTDALNLLERIRHLCTSNSHQGPIHRQKGGGLLIGVDNVKPLAVLESAYNDALGVTAAFNRNLLLHVNRLLGSDFDLDGWAHFAKFDEAHARIEMHLESLVPQTVRWSGGSRHFVKHERIHTENSYKWTPEAFVDLLQSAGFSAPMRWTDPQHWFNVYWAPC